jgi:hypothetical protein
MFRREKIDGGVSPGGLKKAKALSKVASAASGPLNGATPSGDFLPPGFSLEVPAVSDEDRVTYFLQSDRRGIVPYLPAVTKHYQEGFRAVLVGPPHLIFESRNTTLVGRAKGDQYEKGVEWVKSNVLKELHQQYLISGGGTAKEREEALKKYQKARDALHQHDVRRMEMQNRLDEASIGLVLRFGKQPLVMDGVTYDPSYARSSVYWKRRGGS